MTHTVPHVPTFRNFSGRRCPAIDVKRPILVTEEALAQARRLCPSFDERYTVQWVRAFARDSSLRASAVLSSLVDDEMQQIRLDASTMLAPWARAGKKLEVWLEGRSGGWLVVDGLPDPEEWPELPELCRAWQEYRETVDASVESFPVNYFIALYEEFRGYTLALSRARQLVAEFVDVSVPHNPSVRRIATGWLVRANVFVPDEKS